MTPEDGPFYEVVREAEVLIADGATVFQRFTCLACRARKAMENPNRFYTSGQCDECGFVTDLVENGCGFMLIQSSDDELQNAVVETIQEKLRTAKPMNRN